MKERGFPYACSSQRGGAQPLDKRATSATLNDQSTATELGWDSDMRCDVPTAPLLAPQPKVREKSSGAGEHHANKKSAYFIDKLQRIYEASHQVQDAVPQVRCTVNEDTRTAFLVVSIPILEKSRLGPRHSDLL